MGDSHRQACALVAAAVLMLVLLFCTRKVALYATRRDAPAHKNKKRRIFHTFGETEVVQNGVWVTSCNSSYVEGVMKLHKSMQNVRSRFPLLCFCTDSVTATQEGALNGIGIQTKRISLASIVNPYSKQWTEAFVKLECWRLTKFDKVCWIDSDTIQLQNCDELLEIPLAKHGIASSIDREEFTTGVFTWRMIQSGVFVLRPSEETYAFMKSKLGVVKSMDGGDQGFLTSVYDDELDFEALVLFSSAYNYGKRGLHRHKDFDLSKIKILHFVGHPKPWKGGENGYEVLQRIWEEI